jgi:glutamate-1-semialdehyde 2,1-aminomutase
VYGGSDWCKVMKWEDACKIMPGGNGLVSKRPELKSENYPVYYQSSHGCLVASGVSGSVFRDFHLMGIGCCTLGYCNDYVDNAVKSAINQGASSLNCEEEYKLAQDLLLLDKNQDMVRFSRLGCDATSQAIRVARAYTGKSKILYWGYHGWHDWYMGGEFKYYTDGGHAVNVGPNLQPNAGIPKCMRKKIAPFELGEELSNIAAVVLEPALLTEDFLEQAREDCNRWDVPLIYDEITSGFRTRLGSCTEVTPDIEIYGKALGNGYPICAIVGKEDVMKKYNDTFISSTFNTERLGFAAGIATLHEMIAHDVQATLCKNGRMVKNIWIDAARKSGIDITVTGLDPLATFSFETMVVHDSDSLRITYSPDYAMTLYQQEMIKKGFLAGSQYYASIAHTAYMNYFSDAVFKTFQDIADNKVKLEGRVIKSGVKHV